jgi:hypothetical protein
LCHNSQNSFNGEQPTKQKKMDQTERIKSIEKKVEEKKD